MTETSEAIAAIDPPVCVHHWKLGLPVSGVTKGECRLCGSLRDFTDSQGAGAFLSRHRPR